MALIEKESMCFEPLDHGDYSCLFKLLDTAKIMNVDKDPYPDGWKASLDAVMQDGGDWPDEESRNVAIDRCLRNISNLHNLIPRLNSSQAHEFHDCLRAMYDELLARI